MRACDQACLRLSGEVEPTIFYSIQARLMLPAKGYERNDRVRSLAKLERHSSPYCSFFDTVYGLIYAVALNSQCACMRLLHEAAGRLIACVPDQFLEPRDPHYELPALMNYESFVREPRQMLSHSGPRGSDQVGDVLIAERYSQRGAARFLDSKVGISPARIEAVSLSVGIPQTLH